MYRHSEKQLKIDSFHLTFGGKLLAATAGFGWPK